MVQDEPCGTPPLRLASVWWYLSQLTHRDIKNHMAEHVGISHRWRLGTRAEFLDRELGHKLDFSSMTLSQKVMHSRVDEDGADGSHTDS
jgi:hypothetical protein